MKKIFVLISLVSMVLIASLVGLRNSGNSGEKSSYHGKATLVIRTLGNTTEEKLDINGLNALEILQQNHNIEVTESWPNKFIKCIDDVCAKSEFWWQFFVNGKLTLNSLDKYYPKGGDIISLKYGGEE